MRKKNTTPFPAGVKVTSRRPPEPEATVVVRGRFTLRPGEPIAPIEGQLEQGPLTAETFDEGDDDRTGQCVYPGDFADYKPKAEVMMRATCHPPSKQGARECSVRFGVGAWSKAVRVIGRRVFTDAVAGASFTEPALFTAMPLRYDTAFGGPDFAPNPVGKGFGTPELPNVEAMGRGVRSRDDVLEPVSFGPINSAWSPRSRKVGSQYGDDYRATRAPFYAADFDWTHFQSAQPDQWLDEYLRGDEELSFENVHPDAALFRARLPGIRVRAFLEDDRGRFREVKMNLDTLFADVEAGILSLTWRGLDPVRERDLSDLAWMLIASESLADAPLPLDHYAAKMEAFKRDPFGTDEAVPPETRSALAAMAASSNESAPEGTDPLAAAFHPGLLKVPPAERSQLVTLLEKLSGLAKNANVDVAGKLAEIQKPAERKRPGTESPLGEAVARSVAQVDKAKALAASHGAATPGAEQFDEAMKNPRLQKLIAVDPPPGPGADLSGRDLTNADLSGLDLSGANLDEALMMGASLRGAKLRGASLRRAILTDADLSEADLTGADLGEAVLSNVSATRAIFADAKLERTVLSEADLTSAAFDRASVKLSMLAAIRARGSRWHGATVEMCAMDRADLGAADFSGASVVSCLLSNASCAGANFSNSVLTKSSFASAELAGAVFLEASGEVVGFMNAKLRGVDFSRAVLPASRFDGAEAEEARFYGADLRRSAFYRAALGGADFQAANLLGANLCHAKLDETSFAGANLYEAQLVGAGGRDCNLSGANTTRARFEQ